MTFAFGIALATAKLNLELQWDAPPECPSAEDVRTAAIAYAGENTSGNFTAAATVQAAAGSYHLHLSIQQVDETDAERDEREVVGASCSDVAEAGAIIVGSVLKIEGAQEESLVEKTPEAPSEPIRRPGRPVQPREVAPHAHFVSWLGAGVAAATLGAGLSPGVALELGERWAKGRFLWDSGIRATSILPFSPHVFARLDGLEVAPGTCIGKHWSSIELSLCARLSLFWLQGTGTFRGGRTDSHFWIAPQLELGFGLSLTDMFQWNLTTGVASFGRTKTFSIENEPIFSTPEWSWSVSGGFRMYLEKP